LNGVLQFTDLRIDMIGKGYVLTIAFTGRCRQSLTDSWRTLEEIDDNVVNIGLVPPYQKWMELDVFKAAKTMPFDVVAVRSLREVSSSLATPVGCSAYPPPTLKIIGFDDVSPLAPEKEIDFAGGTANVFAFGCNEDSKDVVLNTGKDFRYASGTYFRQPQQINKRNSYATSLAGAVAQQFAYFCPADINIGMIEGYPVMKKESGCAGYDFWRVSRRKGFCGNISDDEDAALQTCESGIGANSLSLEPNFISLRAEWLVRKSATATLPSVYKWTIAEKDTVWFAKSAVPCKVDYSLLKGCTQIAASKGAITFDDMQAKLSRNFTVRFKLIIPGSATSFTHETTYEVTDGQVQFIMIDEDILKSRSGVVDNTIDPPISIRPTDEYGNAILGWDCSDCALPDQQPQWKCTSRDKRFNLIANLHTCSQCDETVTIKHQSVSQDDTRMEFYFESQKAGDGFVFRVIVSATDYFRGCPEKDSVQKYPPPIVNQTRPFEVNAMPHNITFIQVPTTSDSGEVEAGHNLEFKVRVRDKTNEIISTSYLLKMSVYKILSPTLSVPGRAYEYCGNPVHGNEVTKCYPENGLISVKNSKNGAHFERVTITEPGDYYLQVSIDNPELQGIKSFKWPVGKALTVLSLEPNEYMGTKFQPWSKAPTTSQAGKLIAPNMNFGLEDHFGNFMASLKKFYRVVKASVKSIEESCPMCEPLSVLYCNNMTICTDSRSSEWHLFEGEDVANFVGPDGLFPLCRRPPSGGYKVLETEVLPVCGTLTLPRLKIEKLWNKVTGVKTKCDAKHQFQFKGIIAEIDMSEDRRFDPSRLVPISFQSDMIVISPSEAAGLAMYFNPFQERASRIFSKQPTVQLLDQYGNPICTTRTDTPAVIVRVCYGNVDMPNAKATQFPSSCDPLSEKSVELEKDGAFYLFEGLYTNRTGINHLLFRVGSFWNLSIRMDVASGVPSRVLVIQQPQASVAEEVVLSSDAPKDCALCVSEVTVGVKILDVAGNNLTLASLVSVSLVCSILDVLLDGTKTVTSTSDGYAVFTGLVIRCRFGPCNLLLTPSFTCALAFRTEQGPECKSNAFIVSVVSSAEVLVQPTKTVVYNLIRGNDKARALKSEIIVEARDSLNQTVRISRRMVKVSGRGDSLACCCSHSMCDGLCYAGCQRTELQKGIAGFPQIMSSQVDNDYTLLFSLVTPYSTIEVRSAPFVVVHDAYSRLVVFKSPTSAVRAGSAFEVQVQVSAKTREFDFVAFF
jgi:hypothetical protein